MTRKTTVRSKDLNWDAAASDYAQYRSGYPASFFELARCFGIGHPDQRILDLGAGTGALALQFARQGARVVALDTSKNQLECLQATAQAEDLSVNVLQRHAEKTGLPASSFDVVTASMCWKYFNQGEIAQEVPRLLASGGRLLVSSIIWTSDDPIAKATDKLLTRLNPASYGVHQPIKYGPAPVPDWITPPFAVEGFHTWTEGIPFTRESWRGRIRASKWIRAALKPDQVETFDQEHDEVLRAFGSEDFLIPHRITVHVLNLEGGPPPQSPRNWFKRLLR